MEWIKDGGIGILFSEKVDRLIYPGEFGNDNYFITNNLLDCLIVNDLYKEKTHSRNR